MQAAFLGSEGCHRKIEDLTSLLSLVEPVLTRCPTLALAGHGFVRCICRLLALSVALQRRTISVAIGEPPTSK